jgi:HSP20 family protein
MANSPVELKRSVPSSAPAQDSLQSLRVEMDRLFDRFSRGFGFPSLRRMFDAEPMFRPTTSLTMPTPAIDIAEEPTLYRLTAELPGMSEQEIELVLAGDTITLKGEKKQESEQKDKNYTMSERSYGSFQRSFSLPDGVDRDKIDASFAKGVLTVTLPKTTAASAQSKKIDVKPA